MATTLGVLVAGGAGARLGAGVPKALVSLGGRTLLERALTTLAPLCDEVAVAAPAALALTLKEGARAAAGRPAVRRVADGEGAPGPLAGMVAGFASCAFRRAVVLGVDFPFMEPGTLVALLERLDRHPAVVPAPGGFLQPLAAAYAPEAAAALAARHAAGEAGPTRALRSLAYLRLEDDEIERLPGGRDGFFNLNTRADLEQAERRLAERTGTR